MVVGQAGQVPGILRMDAYRHLHLLHRTVEGVEAGMVEVDAVHVAAHGDTAEAERAHGPAQFGCGQRTSWPMRC